MGRPDATGRGRIPAARGSAGRDSGDERLDPVRWRRPSRGPLLRLVAVTALLVTAAVVTWSRPEPCAPPPSGAAAGPPKVAAPSGSGLPGAASPGSGLPGAASPGSGLPGAAPPGSGLPGAAPPGSGVPGGASAPVVPAGRVGVPVRLADPAALALVHPGNRVDLLRLDDAAGRTTAVAAAALVVRVTGADDPTAGGLLLAVSPAEAQQAVSAGHGFAILIRPG